MRLVTHKLRRLSVDQGCQQLVNNVGKVKKSGAMCSISVLLDYVASCSEGHIFSDF